MAHLHTERFVGSVAAKVVMGVCTVPENFHSHADFDKKIVFGMGYDISSIPAFFFSASSFDSLRAHRK